MPQETESFEMLEARFLTAIRLAGEAAQRYFRARRDGDAAAEAVGLEFHRLALQARAMFTKLQGDHSAIVTIERSLPCHERGVDGRMKRIKGMPRKQGASALILMAVGDTPRAALGEFY